MKTILTDCDGVLLNWEYAWHEWMEHRGHKRDDGADVLGKVYRAAEMYPDIDDVKRLVEYFNSSAAIGFLPPLRDAQYYVRLLHEKHQYRFVCVTSLSTDKNAHKLRVKNLAKIFGENTFIEHHFLPCGADKDEILEELSHKYKGAYWIEDKIENALCGARFEFDPIVVEHGYNRHEKENYPALTFKQDWQQIYDYITQRHYY